MITQMSRFSKCDLCVRYGDERQKVCGDKEATRKLEDRTSATCDVSVKANMLIAYCGVYMLVFIQYTDQLCMNVITHAQFW